MTSKTTKKHRYYIKKNVDLRIKNCMNRTAKESRFKKMNKKPANLRGASTTFFNLHSQAESQGGFDYLLQRVQFNSSGGRTCIYFRT